jgi:hypothetical protein
VSESCPRREVGETGLALKKERLRQSRIVWLPEIALGRPRSVKWIRGVRYECVGDRILHTICCSRTMDLGLHIAVHARKKSFLRHTGMLSPYLPVSTWERSRLGVWRRVWMQPQVCLGRLPRRVVNKAIALIARCGTRSYWQPPKQ